MLLYTDGDRLLITATASARGRHDCEYGVESTLLQVIVDIMPPLPLQTTAMNP